MRRGPLSVKGPLLVVTPLRRKKPLAVKGPLLEEVASVVAGVVLGFGTLSESGPLFGGGLLTWAARGPLFIRPGVCEASGPLVKGPLVKGPLVSGPLTLERGGGIFAMTDFSVAAASAFEGLISVTRRR